ncbi:MAG: HNH endonuclease [Bacteroidota bacterium]
MPPPYVKTIREEILYEYAKLISRSAYNKLERGFITDRFKKLRDGEITMSSTLREWEREQERPQECVFCGSTIDLTTDHLIPKKRGGDDSPDNLVLACKSCNSSRGEKGVFEWLGLDRKDQLHRLVAGKYLKELLKVHENAGTLEVRKEHIGQLCSNCPLPEVCREWDKESELTCFCLESILPFQR